MTYAERTEVTSERSRAEIERTLRRYQATGFAYGWNHDTATVMFELESRRIRFLLPLPDRGSREFTRTPTGRERAGAAVEKAYEQAVRQRWRALSLVILAKLEAVELTVQGCAVFSLVGVDDAKRHKDVLDRVHRFKIAFSDEVRIVNVDGYIGKSTAEEIRYAQSLGKPISYLVEASDA